MRRVLGAVCVLLTLLVLVAVAVVAWQWWRPQDMGQASAPSDPAQQVVQGAYQARAGNCVACHTARGGTPYAGGRALATEFGTFYAPNITPDPDTGIGQWSADDFWRALHHGRGKDGRFLYPAFPFPSYTKVSRSDADAMFAYLRSLAPVRRTNVPHALRFPYDQRLLLAGWRALYFDAGSYRADAAQPAQWNRGAYLVQGLAHCSGCHSPRNALGATSDPLAMSGGLMLVQDWYAPPLHGGPQALGAWEDPQLAALLKTGVAQHGAVAGPMADVVAQSLQHLSDTDISAMVSYLKSLPATAAPQDAGPQPAPAEAERIMKMGAKLYGDLCVDCHQARGQGIAPDFPPLAGNHAVTSGPAVNAIRIVLNGGYPPSTAGNPYPFGMPPFGPRLSDQEVAAVVSYIRNSWGQQASFVSAAQVNRYRTVPVE